MPGGKQRSSNINNAIPYIILRTTNGDELKFLIDTGSNANYLNPRLAKVSAIKKGQIREVNTAVGKFKVDSFINFNPFPKVEESRKEKFNLYNFHNYFDGLIGYELLQNCKAIIDTENNMLKFKDFKIPMRRKFSNGAKSLDAQENNFFKFSVNIEKGDFYLQEDLEIKKGIILNSGLYRINNHSCFVAVSNETDKTENFKLPKIKIELNNFEERQPSEQEMFTKAKIIFEKIKTNHLNEMEKKNLLSIIADNLNVFNASTEATNGPGVVKHEIKTSDEIPVHTKSYRYPHVFKEEINKQVKELLEKGIIRHSKSPWTSPVWVVEKKPDSSGKKKFRMVIDYRKLNEKTIIDRYPIPNISEILDKLGKMTYFTTLDLVSGFHQVEVEEKDIQKTAFSVDGGHYEFVRMPFGLRNAPSTFMRLMDNVLREHIGKICLVYMDDIIVFASSLQQHLENLTKIFDTLNKYNLKIQIDKCDFLCKEVTFLGHVVTPDGVKPNPDKIKVIKNFPIPKTITELRGFLGILGYYRQFIRDFAKITKPLTTQLKKNNKKIEHTNEFVQTFERCKDLLTDSNLLQYPDFENTFNLTTDASNFAVGAVLSQGTIGKDKPIAYASRTLNKSEINYSTIEKELLAIVWATKHFRPYLYGTKFILYSDHKPLSYAFGVKDANSRLARWRLSLEEFNYEIRYRKGSQNVVADGLSRIRNENFMSEIETVHSADTSDDFFIKSTEKPINNYASQIIFKLGTNNEITEEIFPRKFRHTIVREEFDEQTITEKLKKYLHFGKINCIFAPGMINKIQEIYKKIFCKKRDTKSSYRTSHRQRCEYRRRTKRNIGKNSQHFP